MRHPKRHMITAAVAITILTVTAPAGAGLLGLSTSTPGSVYDVNPATGAASLITNLTGSIQTSFVGLEVLAGTVYATDVFTSGGTNFGTIDLTTGAFIPINDQGGSSNWGALAADPAANLLYTVDLEQSTFPLLSVTPLGVITTIGDTNQFITGLAFDSDTNVLYGVDGTSLYTIDAGTGFATPVGATGISNGSPGLAFDTESDILYLNVGGSDPNADNLYRVDTGTGLATLVGPNGSTEGLGIDGLAFVPSVAVPEPATAPLLVIGAVGLVVWAYLRQKRSGPTPTGA
jgi:hypothetical protein